jgi:uncharacterized repeat protein (TIGR03943 family)
MKPSRRRIIHALAVLCWSGALLYFYASGRINSYIAADFRPITFAGGLGLAVLGLFNLLTVGEAADCGHSHGAEDHAHEAESHEMHPLTSLLLMVVPVVFSVAWTKDHYSVGALAQKGLYTAPKAAQTTFLASTLPPPTLDQIEKSHRKNAAGFYQFSLMELFFATGDREVQTLIDGLKIETEGRWIEEKQRNPAGTRKRLYRLFITCCAADSKPVPIILEFGKEPPTFAANSWVKVTGTMRFPLEAGELQPVLMVEDVAIAAPPYEESFMRK